MNGTTQGRTLLWCIMGALSVVAMFCVLSGCQYSANADKFLTRKPAAAEIAGRYELKMETVTRSDAAASARVRSSIVLSPDGNCEVDAYPDWDTRTSAQQGTPKLLSGSGTYGIEKAGMVNDETCYGICISLPGHDSILMNLAKENDCMELIVEYGDPDQWSFAVWSRVPDGSAPAR